MIPFLILLVLIGLLAAAPALAIPSPDFLGPALSWLVAMVGILSAIFGTVALWARRALKSLDPRKRRPVWFIVIGFFVGLLFATITAAYVKYENAGNSFREKVAELRRQFIGSQSTSTQNDDNVPNGLITSRVTRGTVLVPVRILQDVVREPDWDKRLVLLDIREAEEREIGVVKASSTWMRYGDLINGGADELPKDKDILVLCWTSIRGEEIALWLRRHGFPNTYAILGGLQGDIDKPAPGGWIASGLPWKGKSRWSSVFGKQSVMKLEEAKSRYDSGGVVVDMRSDEAFDDWHIKGAISLPLETAPSSQVEKTISALPKNRPLIIYCDGYVNCFYGRVLGIRLSRIGWPLAHPFDDARRDWRILGYPAE